MAVKGAFSDLKVVLQGAVLGGDATFDLQLLVNYSPGYTGFEACTDNVLSCQILDDEDTCTVDTDTCEVDVGDLIVWELVLAGTLGGTDQYANWQIKFTADSGSRYPLIMTTLNQVQTEPRYLTIAGNSLIDSEPEEVSTRAPVDGSITDFKCVLDQASGSGSRTFTVYRDDVSTALSCLIANPDTFCDIDTDVVPYDKDSIYYIVHTETVGPSQDNYVTCGLELTTVNGDFPILGGHWGNTSLDSDRWMGSQNTQHTQGTIDTAIYHNTTAWTPTDLYFSVENPPGTSNGYDLRVQEDLVDNIRVDLGPTDTENVTTGGTDQMAAGSEMTIWFDPTNTPDNPDQVLWSIGGTVP
jgi:hypothetical protein